MHTEVTVPNANYELVPGMYASVKIPLHTVTNVLTIPLQAVQSTGTGQGTVLLVNSSNRVERREVTLGLQIGLGHGSHSPASTKTRLSCSASKISSKRASWFRQNSSKPQEWSKPTCQHLRYAILISSSWSAFLFASSALPAWRKCPWICFLPSTFPSSWSQLFTTACRPNRSKPTSPTPLNAFSRLAAALTTWNRARWPASA